MVILSSTILYSIQDDNHLKDHYNSFRSNCHCVTKYVRSEKAAKISSEKASDNQPITLSFSQAYAILKNLTAPDGGRYLTKIKDKYENSPEERRMLEQGLRAFWKDFGENAAINALRNRFVIEPAMLMGNIVNPEVSKILVRVS